jgi:hypothetical protein
MAEIRTACDVHLLFDWQLVTEIRTVKLEQLVTGSLWLKRSRKVGSWLKLAQLLMCTSTNWSWFSLTEPTPYKKSQFCLQTDSILSCPFHTIAYSVFCYFRNSVCSVFCQKFSCIFRAEWTKLKLTEIADVLKLKFGSCPKIWQPYQTGHIWSCPFHWTGHIYYCKGCSTLVMRRSFSLAESKAITGRNRSELSYAYVQTRLSVI